MHFVYILLKNVLELAAIETCTNINTYSLHGAEPFLTGLQLVKKFPTFYGTRRFITALTSHLSILGQPNPVHILTSNLLEIHPNIIHPSTPRSPQWSPSHRFPQQDQYYIKFVVFDGHLFISFLTMQVLLYSVLTDV